MKTAWFIFMSIALHAAALAYPALFVESRATSPVVVTVIDDGGGSNAAGPPAGGDKTTGSGRKAAAEKGPERGAAETRQPAARPEQAAEPARVAAAERLPEPAEPLALPVIPPDVNGTIPIAAGAGESVILAENAAMAGAAAPRSGAAASNEAGTGAGRGGIGAGSGEENGSGGGAGRGGAGSGSGNGQGSGGGASFVQARYASCPRPDYPEAARREGSEGTVTLRVLVDEQGKVKSIEVNRSSGFAVLDQAALDNVKRRCRFEPAREGARPVESRIRIPVVFRLADFR